MLFSAFVIAVSVGSIVGMAIAAFVGSTMASCLMHGALRLIGEGREHGLRATVRISCYAMGTGWIGLVPQMGMIAHLTWWTGMMVFGCAKVHRIESPRSAVVLAPLALLIGATMLAYMVVMMSFVVVAEVLGA